MPDVTKHQIISEFFRLCDNVTKAEEADLLDVDEAQAMRDRYRERADELLEGLRVLVPTA